MNFKKQNGFALLVAIASLANLYNCIFSHNIISALVSLIGLIGLIFFLRNKTLANSFIRIWIYAQSFIIEPFYDASQGFSFVFGLSGGNYAVQFNFVVLIYFFLYKLACISGLENKKINLEKFRDDNRFGDVFPITGVVMERVAFFSEKTWLLICFDKELVYNGNNYSFGMIKAKDGMLRLESYQQISDLRLVDRPEVIKDGNYEAADFPFIDWVKASIE